MKRFFILLPALLGSLLSPAQSGIHLYQSPAAVEYRAYLPAPVQMQLRHLEQRAPARPAAATARNPAPVLDSTKLFGGYGLINGSADSTPWSRKTYQYPQANATVEIESIFENGEWLDFWRTTSIYDEQQRLVDQFVQQHELFTGQWINQSRAEQWPHADSPDAVDSAFISTWTGVDWQRISWVYNTFDAADRLETSTSILDIQDNLYTFVDVWTYDPAGRLVRIRHHAQTAAGLVPLSELAYAYDQDLLASVTFSDYPDPSNLDLKEPLNRLQYVYNAAGQVILEENLAYDLPASNWVITETTSLEYDTEGRVAAQLRKQFPEGGGQEITRRSFTYFDGEQYAVVTEEINDGISEQLYLDNREFYYYRQPTTGAAMPTTQRLAAWPNPAVDFVQLGLEEKATVEVFNANGQLVLSRTLYPRQVLHLYDLKPGVYYVRAAEGARVLAARLEKI